MGTVAYNLAFRSNRQGALTLESVEVTFDVSLSTRQYRPSASSSLYDEKNKREGKIKKKK